MRLHLAAFVLALTPVLSVCAQPQDAVEQAARDVVRRYVDARERLDRAALESLFTADADQLVSSGEWRRGRDAVVRGGLASSSRTGGTRSISIETVRRIGADVVLADGRYEIAGSGGGPPRSMWTTFVLTREGGEWRISAIRNMLPAPPAPATPSPVKSGQ